jgi:hypothetical protein
MGFSLGLSLASADAGASDSYSPADLGASLLMWLDGQNTATLFTDTTEATPSANGAAVGRWKDLSGNARHADQAVAGSKPTRSDTALNSNCGLTLDGGDGLVAPTIGALGAYEVWLVASVGAGTQILCETYNGSAEYFALYYDGASVVAVVPAVGAPAGVALSASTGALVRLIVDTSLASGAVIVEVDGVQSVGGANGNIGEVIDANSVYVGRRFDGTFGLSGAAGELVVVSRTLTGGEATSLRTYLQTRWGTP